MPIPTLYTLEQCAELLRGTISAKTLRRQVNAGKLKCVRPTAGANARILIQEEELARWVREVAAKRQHAPSSRRH